MPFLAASVTAQGGETLPESCFFPCCCSWQCRARALRAEPVHSGLADAPNLLTVLRTHVNSWVHGWQVHSCCMLCSLWSPRCGRPQSWEQTASLRAAPRLLGCTSHPKAAVPPPQAWSPDELQKACFSCRCAPPLRVPNPMDLEFSSELWKVPLVKAKHNPSRGKKKLDFFNRRKSFSFCFPPTFSSCNLRVSWFYKSNESICFNVEFVVFKWTPQIKIFDQAHGTCRERLQSSVLIYTMSICW